MKILLLLINILVFINSLNYYEILEIPKTASTYTIKKAFRQLSKKFHPDKNRSPGSAEKYQQINRAHEILKDSNLRRVYDSQGEEGVLQYQQKRPSGEHDPFDFYSNRKNIEKRGATLKIKLQLTLEDVYNGSEIILYLTKKTICSHCRGSGANNPNDVKTCPQCNGEGHFIRRQQIAPGYFQQYQHQCEKCGGRGRTVTSVCHVCRGQKSVDGQDELIIKINKGIEEGQNIRMEGAGDEYFDTSPSDVLFQVSEVPHLKFVRRRHDLYYTLDITFQEALLGFKKKIQHLDSHYVKIQRNQITSPGESQRIPGEGMPIMGYEGRFGDLYVEFRVRFENYYSQDKIELLKKYFIEENNKR